MTRTKLLLNWIHPVERINQIFNEQDRNSHPVRDFPPLAGVFYCMVIMPVLLALT